MALFNARRSPPVTPARLVLFTTVGFAFGMVLGLAFMGAWSPPAPAVPAYPIPVQV